MNRYSPSNHTEYLFFLQNNCCDCKKYNPKMHEDYEINDCNILWKLLNQMALDEKEFPDDFQFEDSELKDGCPAICLQKEKK